VKTTLLLTLVMIALFSGCKKTAPPALSEDRVRDLISGKYEGDYDGGWEYFDVRTNGTFSQTFIQNGVTVYSLEGKWTFEKMEDRYLVWFGPFMDLRDAIVAKGGSPEKVASCQATFYEDEPRIYFFRKIYYFVVKPAEKKTANKTENTRSDP
jgi:hypothetical protein